MHFTSTDINSSNTWQIGTGDDTRNYFDIFLKYGVALVGPGNPGPEGETKTLEYYSKYSKRNWGAELLKVKKGEWLIARKGRSMILGVGRVIEEYNYSNLFSDVEGWDLQHFIKVHWYVPDDEFATIFLRSPVLSMSTLQSSNNQEVYNAIYDTSFVENIPSAEVDAATLNAVAISHIVDALIDEGVRIQDAENVGSTIHRIIRLADYYVKWDGNNSEAEIVSFLVIPLLIALGWSEQKIKVEYNRIDVALFNKAFVDDYKTTPSKIVEVKKFHNGLAFTDDQVNSYAEKFSECKSFVVTNGVRYKYFERENDKLVFKGYFNLLSLKESNSLYALEKKTIGTMLAISAFNT